MKKFLAVAFLAVVTQAKTQVINLQAPQAGEKAVKRIVASENKSIVRVDVPACDIQMMWMPAWRVPRQERKWLLQYTSAPQLSMPYVAYFNMVGRNSFSIGVSALEYDVNIESKINQEKGVQRP